MKIFMSYYSGEQSEAEDMADHLGKMFAKQGVELFLASRWESITPSDIWEPKVLDALDSSDALLVLMSIDALQKHWVNFEIGFGWARKARVLIFCHKGLTPSGLPRPYSSLQTVEINNLTHNEKMDKIAHAVAHALNLQLPTEAPATADIEDVEAKEPESFASAYRAWSLRPAGHIDETANGRFVVGKVYPSRPELAEGAKLQPGETLYVRLHTGPSEEGRYIQTLVSGANASFFETVWHGETTIDATLRLAAAFNDGEKMVPIIVIESFDEVVANK
jgi:hypothetical protein